MLSRGLRHIGDTGGRCWSSTPPRYPFFNYDFIRAGRKDKGKIMDVALNLLINTEPHCVALGITKNGIRDFVDWIVSKSLYYPHSFMIGHKESGKIMGFRLMSVSHRDTAKDFNPFEIEINRYEESVQIFASILDSLKQKIWEIRPEANKILRREITFVHRDHQRQGIAQYLLHHGLDFDRLRADGFDGIQSEASSNANQALLAKNGYAMLLESPRKSYTRSNGQPIIFPDETKCVQLCYFNFRK